MAYKYGDKVCRYIDVTTGQEVKINEQDFTPVKVAVRWNNAGGGRNTTYKVEYTISDLYNDIRVFTGKVKF